MSSQYGGPSTTIIVAGNQGPGLMVRLLWFVFVGWWVGLWATVIGWALCMLVITLPFGLVLLNRLPAIMTLRPASNTVNVSQRGDTMQVSMGARQYPFLLRALYFVVVGSWLSAIWLIIAWGLLFFTLGIGFIPAFLMFDRVPLVLTLRRN